jgi:putative Mg2+ transporter-C (MgtC) family protein
MLRLELLLKLLLAVVLGGIVGIERELSGKPAGLRTNILICLGATMLMVLSLYVGELNPDTNDGSRIAAQIVSGVGFIGAGTILHARGVIVGLTSAATIWVVAAIGMLIGAGLYVDAVGGTVLVALVLIVLTRVERWMLTLRRVVQGTVRVTLGLDFAEISQLLEAYGITVQRREVFETRHERIFELKLRGPAKQFDTVAAELMRRPDVLGVSFD